jgi:hypothetical protein
MVDVPKARFSKGHLRKKIFCVCVFIDIVAYDFLCKVEQIKCCLFDPFQPQVSSLGFVKRLLLSRGFVSPLSF